MTTFLGIINVTDCLAEISIDGIRYEYRFGHPDILRKVELLFRRWPKRGLNFAKTRAIEWRKIGA